MAEDKTPAPAEEAKAPDAPGADAPVGVSPGAVAKKNSAVKLAPEDTRDVISDLGGGSNSAGLTAMDIVRLEAEGKSFPDGPITAEDVAKAKA